MNEMDNKQGRDRVFRFACELGIERASRCLEYTLRASEDMDASTLLEHLEEAEKFLLNAVQASKAEVSWLSRGYAR